MGTQEVLKAGLTLPSAKSKKSTDFKEQKIGMIGAAKIGKSEFFAQDPNVLFIEAEAGLNHLEVFKMRARSWDDLRSIYGLLLKEKEGGKFPYSMIVIDTIDRVYDFAEEVIIQRGKEFYKSIADDIHTIGDIPNGMGWAKVRELIMSFLNKLEELPCAIAFIGHLAIKKVKEGNREYDKSTINISGKTGLELLAWADHVLHVESSMMGDKMVRRVITRPSQSKEAGSRGAMVPANWVWKDSAKENYDFFRKLFV